MHRLGPGYASKDQSRPPSAFKVFRGVSRGMNLLEGSATSPCDTLNDFRRTGPAVRLRILQPPRRTTESCLSN